MLTIRNMIWSIQLLNKAKSQKREKPVICRLFNEVYLFVINSLYPSNTNNKQSTTEEINKNNGSKFFELHILYKKPSVGPYYLNKKVLNLSKLPIPNSLLSNFLL